MSNASDRIIAKMKKLLAMAEGKANENEAMVATRQLHAMLAKHNVSMSQLTDEPAEDLERDGVEVSCKPWKRVVAQEIAKLYFCKFYIMSQGRTSRKTHYMFIGTEANRTFAMHIAQMVIRTIERESRKACTEQRGKRDSAFLTSFRAGACDRVIVRCRELMEAAKEGTLQDDEGNTLPALVSQYEQNQLRLDEWAAEHLSLTSVKNRLQRKDAAGYEAGERTGNRVQLSRAIHGKTAPKLLS